jgi:hypothetical protein
VPTVTFGILYVFFVLSHERRRVLHIDVTRQPHAAWAAQQIVEAIGGDLMPMPHMTSGARTVGRRPTTPSVAVSRSFSSGRRNTSAGSGQRAPASCCARR